MTNDPRLSRLVLIATTTAHDLEDLRLTLNEYADDMGLPPIPMLGELQQVIADLATAARRKLG